MEKILESKMRREKGDVDGEIGVKLLEGKMRREKEGG